MFNPRLKSRISSSLCPGMRLIVNVHHVLDRKLRVALRGRQALVAEQFLDGAQVRSLLQHVGAEGVTQSMGMNLGGQSLGNGDSLDDAAYAAGGEASAALVDYKGGHAFRWHRFFRRA